MRGPYLQQAYKMVSPVFVDMDVSLTIVLSACVFTTHTQGSSTLLLTSSPSTASPGQPYTLMCSSSGSGGRSRAWYWRDDVIFHTRYVSDTQCTLDISNNDRYREYLSGRVNVSCSYNLHNVTLRVNTSIDNGSVWRCVDSQDSLESNRWTIHISNLMPSTTTTAATTTTTADTTTTTATGTSPMSDVPSSTVLQGGGKDSSDVVSVAVGAAVGGAVVGCVLTVVVVVVWMRRRHRNADYNPSLLLTDYNPSLLFTDYNPSLLFTDYNPSLLFMDYNPSLLFMDYNPSLLFTDYNPSLLFTD
ncbi:uncharacterized protein LOC124265761 isoform X2 [Haliotis rubra]|uniref:uncharacterized protein LOC124265761 isoform X2 n=1 Tax=Haliotis rubra TaxID=36100 RepID=UPI001EE5C5AA|nr:uncharacterized protein LOC124265761 isoform X2 [Haliotis rubra]